MIPDYQSLMLPVLRIANERETSIADAVERVANEFGSSDLERSALLPSGRQSVLANRVHWAKTYLKQAGLLEPVSRGIFTITARGKEALEQNLPAIDLSYLEQFAEYRAFRGNVAAKAKSPKLSANPSHEAVAEETATPEDNLRSAHKQVLAELKSELLQRVQNAKPDFFERLIVGLLTKIGYGGSVENAGRAIGRSGDGGVDGLIDQDVLGLDRVYVQAKRYASSNTVGPGMIREFFGALDRQRANKGVFVTTSTFSKDALMTARELSKRIVLIDGWELADLMVRFNVGCQTEETFALQRVDEDFFEGE